jgi:protein TonB
VEALKPWHLSFLFHFGTAALIIALSFFRLPSNDVYEVPIEISAPAEVQNLNEIKEKPKVVLKSVNEPVPELEAKPAREIFGANRNAYTDSSLGEEGVDAKKGNTLAKEVDQTKLEDSDASTLPTPTEEYLVSEMPVVLSEVRPVYPKEAREKQLEGAVALDVLIDEQGMVRQVKVIEGAEIFREGAVEAMKKFRFKAAKVDGKAVAVRIRYSLNFKLEF